MKKQKDIKRLLFENMAKINPDFKILDGKIEDEGFNPLNLLKRDGDDKYSQFYKKRAEELKQVIDNLFNERDFDILDTLYHFMVRRGAKAYGDKKINPVQLPITEDHSPEYQQKAEQIKGKIDFLVDSNHYDILDKVDIMIDKLFPQSDHDLELAETQNKDIYFETLSAALDVVRERVGKKGYSVDEDAMFTSFGTGGINYGMTQRATIPLLKNGIPAKNRSVIIAIYRMDSGQYELTAYMN